MIEIGLSFLSKTRTLIGVDAQMGVELVKGFDGNDTFMQRNVSIYFGFLLFYIKLTIGVGKPELVTDILKSIKEKLNNTL